MKKWLSMLLISVLSACSTQYVTEENPTQVQPQVLQAPRVIGKLKVPEGTPDGEFSGAHSSNGRTFKTVIKNGYIDKYFDIYHPNGKLHSHTPLVKGIAQGWSFGYSPEGILRTKVLYKDGAVIESILLNDKGHIIKHIK